MRILTLIILLIASTASTALAEPMLIADPYPPGSGISAFGVVVDGGVTEYVPYSEENGQAVVYRGGVLNDPGRHQFEVWAISVQPGRGSGKVPFLLYEQLKPLSNIGFKP